ncbi:MAG TPA: transposase, partial [Leptospiraceae bacterium]|nr:transposase [Leptospiraceae bacterium]
GAWEGSTENARVCTDLLHNLTERGLKQESVKLFILDGGKGIHKAVTDVFGNNILIQRCQIHKKRNVKDYLPESMKTSVESIMNDAYPGTDYARSKKMLENLAASLRQKGQGSAAASLMEGLEETLTLLRLGAPEEIQKTLCSTNAIENLNGSIRRMTQRVKRWSGNDMLMRWVSSALIESERNFRRLKGYKSIPVLLDRISRLNKVVLPEVA